MKIRVATYCAWSAVFLSLLLLPLPGFSSKTQSTRVAVRLDAQGEAGVVIFDHKKHEAFVNPDSAFPHKSAAGKACIGCHHTVTNVTIRQQFQKCSACHKMEGDPVNPVDTEGIDLSAVEVFHRSCIGCHMAAKVNTSNERIRNAAFTKCGECHDPGEPSGPPAEPDPVTMIARELTPKRTQADVATPPPYVPPGYAGPSRIRKPERTSRETDPIPDRWRIGFPDDPRYKKGSAKNPYGQNVLKGDYPIFGQHTFLNLTLQSDTFANARRLPVPSDVSSQEPGSSEFFGRGNQVLPKQNFVVSMDLFHGDTAYKPVDWRLLISPNFNVNYLHTQENGIVNIDVRRENTRTDSEISLQEAFGEIRLWSTNPYFDTTSARVGIQPFISDFRGFLFYDVNLGARLFGNFGNNRYQYNASFFDMLEKDTNSELNTFEWRDQRVFIANFFRQDTFTKGYAVQFSYHYNQDQPGLHTGELKHNDRNGFPVRPALIGDVRPHEIKAHYIGWTSDGHLGRLNVTHALYQAFGEDERNPIANQKVDINAQMAALELSVDKDWLRYKGSVFWSSGDSEPFDDDAKGFDAIFDFPEFAGGKFSFWNQQGIRLTQTGVALVNPDSLLPSLRSSKTEGQASFVNPGLFLYNLGIDADLTPKLKGILNLNYLRFHRTEPLEALLFQEGIRKDIGFDAGIGFLYRPFLNENAMVAGGFSGLIPGKGLKDIFSSNCSGQGCGADAEFLYSVFLRVKFTY